MSRTVTALYDTRADAEAARERLSSEVDVEGRAKIIDQSSMGGGDQRSSDFHSVPLSHQDRAAYGEGLRRGGFMLCAEVDEDEDADKIVSLLEQTSRVDLDQRQTSWRNEGWTGSSDQQTPSQPAVGGRQDREMSVGSSTEENATSFGSSQSSDRSNVVEEERIPVIDEQLRVGKREVERGGTRVRSYVEERPVSESVNLREEHVSIERRPVDRPISSADIDSKDLLQDRVVEVREMAEEAVVSKEARVTEEVVVQKTTQQHNEQVQDTVRHTNVEIEDGKSDTERAAFGFNKDRDATDQR
jgi:uncharacterized protein (TIGR02271 family)